MMRVPPRPLGAALPPWPAACAGGRAPCGRGRATCSTEPAPKNARTKRPASLAVRGGRSPAPLAHEVDRAERARQTNTCPIALFKPACFGIASPRLDYPWGDTLRSRFRDTCSITSAGSGFRRRVRNSKAPLVGVVLEVRVQPVASRAASARFRCAREHWIMLATFRSPGNATRPDRRGRHGRPSSGAMDAMQTRPRGDPGPA
jgi:hypothetical protein